MPCLQESVGIRIPTKHMEERGKDRCSKDSLVKGKVMVCFKRGGDVHIHIFTSFPSDTSESFVRLDFTPSLRPCLPLSSSPIDAVLPLHHEPKIPLPLASSLFSFPSRPSPSPTFSGTMFFDRYKEPTFFAVPTTFFFSLSSKAREAGTFLFCCVFVYQFFISVYEEQVSTISIALLIDAFLATYSTNTLLIDGILSKPGA